MLTFERDTDQTLFITTITSFPHSHLLSVPAGPQLLSDIILSSPVLQEEGGDSGAGPSGSGGGSNQFEFGVDPSMDPELAMVSTDTVLAHSSGRFLFSHLTWHAVPPDNRSDDEPNTDIVAICTSQLISQALRLSLEEEQARQRAVEGSSGSQAPTLPTVSEGTESSAPAPATASSTAGGLAASGSMVLPGAESITGEGRNADDESEEAMLQKAIALSQAGEASHTHDEDVDMASAEPSAGRRAVVAGQGQGEEDEEMDEDEAIARAIQMSLQEGDGQDESN